MLPVIGRAETQFLAKSDGYLGSITAHLLEEHFDAPRTDSSSGEAWGGNEQ